MYKRSYIVRQVFKKQTNIKKKNFKNRINLILDINFHKEYQGYYN